MALDLLRKRLARSTEREKRREYMQRIMQLRRAVFILDELTGDIS